MSQQPTRTLPLIGNNPWFHLVWGLFLVGITGLSLISALRSGSRPSLINGMFLIVGLRDLALGLAAATAGRPARWRRTWLVVFDTTNIVVLLLGVLWIILQILPAVD